jgi:hypothetical protein
VKAVLGDDVLLVRRGRPLCHVRLQPIDERRCNTLTIPSLNQYKQQVLDLNFLRTQLNYQIKLVFKIIKHHIDN